MKGLITDKNSGLAPATVGEVYGRLTVTGLAGYTMEKAVSHEKTVVRKKAVYDCLCECGNTKQVRKKDLDQGKIKSCGCYHKETSTALGKANQLPDGEAAFNFLYSTYKYSSKQREINFLLTKEEFKDITSRDCKYCGVAPVKDASKSHKTMNSHYIYNGIDRIDSNGDYTVDNVVPCCEQCNYAKLDYTEEEFLNWIDRIAKYQGYKKNLELLN